MKANETTPSGALVVAADEEMRILLRGLLQLHRVHVDAEADGLTTALRLLQERQPGLLVVDSHLSEGNAVELVRAARLARPGLRVILVAPASRPPPAADGAAAPDALLLKPFRIQEFADAIAPRAATEPKEAGPEAGGPAPPPPPG